MKKNRLIYLLIFIFSVCLFGQVKNKDDLKKMSYDVLKENYNESNKKNEKIQYATLYLNKGKKESSSIRIAKGFYLLAYLEYDVNNKKALNLLDSVIKYSKMVDDTIFPAAAYREKADLLVKETFFKEAVENYKEAENYALKNNIDYYYIVRDAVANIKSENLGQVEDALEIYKEIFKFYSSKSFRNKKYSDNYLNIIFGLADVYKSLNKVDSSSYYNKLGYKEALIAKSEEYKYIFILNEGANQTVKGNYNEALDSLKKALPKMIFFKDSGNILASYYYRGKAYQGLGEIKLAVDNYIKVDSIFKLRKKITPEFVSGYLYLINYYKDRGDKLNQLKYLTTYITIDSTLQKNYKVLDKQFQKNYDFPHLIKEKQTLIESLKNKTKFYYLGILCLLLTIIGLVIYQQNIKKIYHLRFEKIIAESNTLKEKNAIININEFKDISIDENQLSINKIREITISEEIVSLILKKLEAFEHEKGFLSGKVSVKSLSEDFETNSKYLSKIVNEYKNKTFINYINDLRIDYAVINLQESKTSRKYTLQALAIEYGFNTAESFSTAFSKKTGLKPSYFIKELENTKI
ncbi:helix-turn-helix domain-containing protein [Flavobacterium sp.]|jgi:AraC-like DNA-binding protein|uniref:helix-turn-helix domain-containing protein n=1 Tax=Flavobacterium sp. TaxID=239 RepID=UPI0037BF6C6E